MDKLVIDTNVFESKDYNFSSDNYLIKLLIDNVDEGKYEYVNISILDNEISRHIANKCTDAETTFCCRKNRWVYKYISPADIKKELHARELDYKKFKKRIHALNVDVSNINAESVFLKYFSCIAPFEAKKDKKCEFPDAFVVEKINSLAETDGDVIHCITRDNGFKSGLSEKVKVYSSIEEFLLEINGYDKVEYYRVGEFIKANIDKIENSILEFADYTCWDLVDEVIETEDIVLSEKFDYDVLDVIDNSIYVNCKFDSMILKGNFTCLDVNNSCFAEDEGNYVYTEYIRASDLILEDYEIILMIEEKDGKYIIKPNGYYNIRISYDNMLENRIENFIPYEDYDGEDSWAQDGGLR